MLPRLEKFWVLVVFGAVLCFPAVELRPVWAQGRNIFQSTPSNSPPPQPKADAETRQRLTQSFRQEFSNDGNTYVYAVVLLLFLVALIGGLVYFDYWQRQKSKSDLDDPKMLFRELCAAHRLTAAEKKFLRDFAEDMNLEDPLPLFIEPNYYVHALRDPLFERSGQIIAYLLNKFFDVTLTPEMPSSFAKSAQCADTEHVDTTILIPSPLRPSGPRL